MSIRKFSLLVLFVFLFHTGSGVLHAWKDGSGKFRERAIWLADNFPKETKIDFLRRSGMEAQYVDTRPPTVGEEKIFLVNNFDTEKSDPTPAVLRKIGQHCYIFVEKGQEVDPANLNRIVKVFDEEIYPKNRESFGSEWTPGIDNDPRITLLLLKDIAQGTAGFFFPDDEYPRAKSPVSNEREMLYLKIKNDPKELDEFLYGVLTHEFQHLIHWHSDPREYAWFDEACAETSCYLFGVVTYFVEDHFAHPYRSLVDWEDTTDSSHYGDVFLFLNFLLQETTENEKDRKALLRRLVASPKHGIQGFVSVFQSMKLPYSFQQLFKKYCVALHFNDPDRPNNRPFGFDSRLNTLLKKFDTRKVAVRQTFRPPFLVSETMKLWSSKGFHFSLSNVKGPLYLDFRGKTQTFKKSANAFKIGALFFDSKNHIPPVLEWVQVKRNTSHCRLQTPFRRFDSLLIVVCNIGSAGMDNGKPNFEPAKFSLALSLTPKQQPLLTQIAAGEQLSQFQDLLLEYSEQTQENDREQFEQTEEEILSHLRNSNDKSKQQQFLRTANRWYGNAQPQEKRAIFPLMRKISDMVRFTKFQERYHR